MRCRERQEKQRRRDEKHWPRRICAVCNNCSYQDREDTRHTKQDWTRPLSQHNGSYRNRKGAHEKLSIQCTLCPFNQVPVNIAGAQVMAVIDTGASINCMSENLFVNCSEEVQRTYRKLNDRWCKVASGSLVKIEGVVHVPITMNNETFSACVHLFADPSFPLLLGVPFLRQHKAHLDFGGPGQATMTLTHPVYAASSVTIPPHSTGLFVGCLREVQIADNVSGDCSNIMKSRSGMAVIDSAVTPVENRIPVQVYNHNDWPRRVKQGDYVAQYTSWSDDVMVQNVTSLDKDGGKDAFEPNVDLSSDLMTGSEKIRMRQLINEYADCFVDPAVNEVGKTGLMKHRIDLIPGAKPFSCQPYRVSPHMRDEMKKILNEQMRQGLITKVIDGAWGAAGLLVKKADGTMRLVCDYRRLNAQTIGLSARIPRLDDIFDSVGQNNPKYFTSLDVQSSFHQIEMEEGSVDYTAFVTPHGKFRYTRMPQGLKNASNSFQALIDLMLTDIQYQFVLAYIDDLIIYSDTFDAHIAHVREVFERLRKAGLKLKASKAKIGVPSVPFLGHILSNEGILPNPQKTEVIRSYPVPRRVKDVRAFLGMCGFYRRFVKDYSLLARPLYDLTKKDVAFKWTDKQQEAFDKLKDALVTTVLLQYPDFNRRFVLHTDASKVGLGAVLSQDDGTGKLRPVAFAGRATSKAEMNYSTTMLELAAIIWSFNYFKIYLSSAEFDLYTDHAALKWILGLKEVQGKLARWTLTLQEYAFVVRHVKGKDNVVSDVLSRREYNDESEGNDVYVRQVGASGSKTPPPGAMEDRERVLRTTAAWFSSINTGEGQGLNKRQRKTNNEKGKVRFAETAQVREFAFD